MNSRYHLTLKSSNRKTGNIPVTTSSRDTCPDACPMKANGCYAEGGHLRLHWDSVTNGKRGMTFKEFRDKICELPKGQLWRHDQAGDLPGKGDVIDPRDMTDLIMANTGKRGFTYTHKPPQVGRNLELIESANIMGFTVNLSANSREHSD